NSKDYIIFRSNVEKEHLGTYLIALCKYYYAHEDASNLLPGSSYTLLPGAEKKVEIKKIYYQCRHCLSIYDEANGEQESAISPGTTFNALPETWCCALCEAPKTAFIKQEIILPGLQTV
ncbi:MAG: rubredoxin, partial [Bacteroidota bacterium]